MRNPWLSSFAAAENARAKKCRMLRNARVPKARMVDANGRRSRAHSLRKNSLIYIGGVQFIVRRGASTVVRACDRREPSLKNFLKSSFVSDGLARPKAQRTGTLYGRIVADPAATSCSHRRILSRYMILPWTAIPFRCPFMPECTSLVVLVATRQIARESSALSSLRNVRTITTHHT